MAERHLLVADARGSAVRATPIAPVEAAALARRQLRLGLLVIALSLAFGVAALAGLWSLMEGQVDVKAWLAALAIALGGASVGGMRAVDGARFLIALRDPATLVGVARERVYLMRADGRLMALRAPPRDVPRDRIPPARAMR